MSYIEEICGYLKERGYVTKDEIKELMKSLHGPSELWDGDDEPWLEEGETYPVLEEFPLGRRKTGSARKGGGSHRGGRGNVKVTAPELDAKLPTLDLGPKLKQFLTFLQWFDGTGKGESNWSWEVFVKETDKFYEMGQAGLVDMLKSMIAKKTERKQFDLLLLYCNEWLVPTTVLDEFTGPVVGVFNSEMADIHVVEWTINKHSWIYRHPNIRTMRRAVIIHNRLRHALAECLQDIVSDSYMVVDLTTWDVSYRFSPPDLSNDRCRTTELWLRKIPKGRFVMGSPESERGHRSDEMIHDVTLTQDFYIGVFTFTQKQWELVMGDNPSKDKGDCCPVVSISYETIRGAGADWPRCGYAVDHLSFMGKLREKTGLMFDLPTEAQWEYACRAGTKTALNSGKNLDSLISDKNMDVVGRYKHNEDDDKGEYNFSYTTVGSYEPNRWGLYDMHGNVWEWCLDWFGNYGTAAVTDPSGPNTGKERIVRGGAVNIDAQDCRSAVRCSGEQLEKYRNVGFRVVCLPSNR